MRVAMLLMLAGLALLVSTATRASNPPKPVSGDKYAVVVGIQDYRNIPPLEYAGSDADELATHFEALGFSVILLKNYEADPQHILSTLHEVGVLMDASEGRENGTLVFTFSGHGFQQDGVNFLATGHAVTNNLRQTALSLERVKNVLKQSGIARQMMFIDACRNDPGKSGIEANRRFVKDNSVDGLAIMYSTGAGELSWEDSQLGQGVFSHYLAKGLGGAAEKDSQITFDNLYSYVSSKVAEHVFKRFDKRQIPYTAGERSGDFLLGKVKAKKPSRDWLKYLTAAGVVALTVAILGASSSSSTDDSDPGVTLVIPTP